MWRPMEHPNIILNPNSVSVNPKLFLNYLPSFFFPRCSDPSSSGQRLHSYRWIPLTRLIMLRQRRRQLLPGFNPWNRGGPEKGWEPYSSDSSDDSTNKRQKFSSRVDNIYPDYPSKRAALKVSPAVVSLVAYSGDEQIFECTGTIIDTHKKSAIVLTSAYLLRCPSGNYSVANNIKVVVHIPGTGSFDGVIVACDFHFSLATIKVKPKTRLTPATLTYLHDSLAVDPSQIPTLLGRRPFGLRKHSDSFSMIPGDSVVAIGCYFRKPYQVMAAPGVFCLERSEYDCKELYMATCKITRCGIGGPLVNCFGDVVGICFYNAISTPFLPINVALTWWEQFKKHGELRRPWLGMGVSNLYTARFEFLAAITRKFPNISEGIFVDEVMPGSSADAAGMKYGDVIIQIGGKAVRSFLELLRESWNNIGEAVDMVVVRKGNDLPVHMSMVVDDVKPDNFYRWELLTYAG